MSFLYISDSTIPSQRANSIQVMQMCDAFSRIAPDVTLFCRASKTTVEDVYSYYGVDARFRLRPVTLPRIKIVDRLLYAYTVLSGIRKAREPRTIYSRELLVAGLACLLPSRSQNQVVLEVHSPPPSRFWKWWIGRIVASGRLSALIPISAALAREYVSIYPRLKADRVLVAHDGARAGRRTDAETILATNSGATSATARIGYVGSLRPGKGMELIQRIAQMMPGAEFHIVGGDPDTVQWWKDQINVPNLTFHGFVEPSRAEAYIAQYDILLAPFQPSVLVGDGSLDIGSWMSPLKIFEYMRMGKPIVASDLPVLREVLVHGRNALLADAADPDDWAKKISSVLDNANLRSALGINARTDFLAHHTWDRRAELILSTLSRLATQN